MPLRYNAQMQENNYAFIDSQNVNLGVQALGWRLSQYLYNHKKLEIVLSPNKKYCSSLLHGAARGNIHFMNTARQELEYN
jgi:hypothetical protein